MQCKRVYRQHQYGLLERSLFLITFGLDHAFFFFFPHLIGGLIINKSEILISEQGTLRHMCPLQEKKTRAFPSGSVN